MHSWRCNYVTEAHRYWWIPWRHKSENNATTFNKVHNLRIFNTTAACVICLTCSDDDGDSRLYKITYVYELTVKLKPVVPPLLCYVSIVHSSFQCLCAAAVSNLQILKHSFLNTWKIFACHLSDVQIKCEILLPLPLLETHCKSSIFVLLAFLLLQEDKPHVIITSSSQLSMLTTVKSGSIKLQKRIRYTAGTAVRIFPAATRTFTKDTALSEDGRGPARHD